MPATHVILLPGMMCDERQWAAQQDAFGVPTTVADLSRGDSFSEMSAELLRNAPPTFALAGLSMGGILAFELWRQAPERISHLALLDTNPGLDDPQKSSRRLKQIEVVLDGGLRSLAIDSLKPFYLAEKNRDDDDLLNVILDMALDLGPEVFKRQSTALINRADSVPTLATITCPTALICGREDALCPIDYHECMAAEISGATLTIIDECGHLSSMEQPDVVTGELRRLFAL